MDAIPIKEYTIKHPKDVSTEETCMLYRTLAELPLIENGGILTVEGGNHKSVSCYATFTQMDLEINEKRKFEKMYKVKFSRKSTKGTKAPLTNSEVESFPFIAEMRDVVCQTYSNDGRLKAVIRCRNQNAKDKEFLEIWSQHRQLKNINLTELDEHGKVMGNGIFSSFLWSDDSKKLLYIAEKKKAKSTSYFERKCKSKKEDDTSVGDKFLYEENWGEGMSDQSQPIVAVYDLSQDKITVMTSIPENISPGQACWGPDESIVFAGWKNTPRKLGTVYCENRESAVYQLRPTVCGYDCVQLSKRDRAAYSPRISPCRMKLAYLERNVGGPHRGCEKLMMYNFHIGSFSVICDIVQENPFSKGGKIGVFSFGLPKRCWVGSDKKPHIILDTFCGVSKSIVSVSVETKEMSLLGILMDESCQTLIDVYKGVALIVSSATNSIPELCLIDIDMDNLDEDDTTFNGTLISIDNPVQSSDLILATITSDIERKLTQVVITLAMPNHGKYESVLLRPSATPDEKMPLIAWIHGGPHSLVSTSYITYAAGFCYQGYAVLLVNYRGSLGYGEAGLQSLLGKVGMQDVKDCHDIIYFVVTKFGIDQSNVFLFGGSHGGFLTTHLLGQYPDLYGGGVVRNPVTNICSMLDATDIPDWCFVESGFDYGIDTVVTSDQAKRMFELSPISHISKIKAPLLILVGTEDKRVPPFQGINFHRLLKGLGKKTKLLLYPDNCHPLNKVDAEADVFINTCNWFKENLK